MHLMRFLIYKRTEINLKLPPGHPSQLHLYRSRKMSALVNKQQIRVPSRDIIAGEQRMEDYHEDAPH